jgi:signal transduction histidine kinase
VQSHIQAHGPPQYVRGPSVELEAALLNLVFNARDAMTEGGEVVIAVAAEIVAAGDHHPAGLAPGVYARISVADTGIGMDAATLAQAAEPFFTTKGPGRGTGLGLSTTRSFVEAAGGGFRIESPGLGCGSTVTVWLPEADAAAVDAQRLSESRVGQPNR